MTATLEDTHRSVRARTTEVSVRLSLALETVAVLASPAILYRVLRLRGMGPPQLPDPSIHTTFILDPHAIVDRYSAVFTPTARLREAGRVGFLIPARLLYLLFGATPAFFIFRYVLALLAIVPLYMLLREMRGRWAGFVGIAVVVSSPVVVAAWGTDFPDSAVVSYLTGAVSALALSLRASRWQLGWMIAGAALLTMAVWAFGLAVPLAAVIVVVYLAVRLRRDRARLGSDLAVLAGIALGLTLLLAIASKFMIGQFDFITPTVKSAQYLSMPGQTIANHSAGWGWAGFDAYLLVPPAIVIAFIVVFARRWRDVDTAVLFIGLTGALQLATFAYLQFAGNVQTLEMHYFSSTLWSSINIMFALTLVEVTRRIPLLGPGAAATDPRSVITRRLLAALPAALILLVFLVYEAHPYVLTLTWMTGGFVIAAVVIAAAVLGRLTDGWGDSPAARRSGARIALTGVLPGTVAVVMVGGILLLTVAIAPPHAQPANTVADPPPAYAGVLNGSMTPYLDMYAIDAQVPAFVGPPAYKGEVLMQWEPRGQLPDLQGPIGLYHNAITFVSITFPVPGARGIGRIKHFRPAQILLMSLTGNNFGTALKSLGRFGPVLVRQRVISHGSYHLHVALIDLRRYLRGHAVG